MSDNRVLLRRLRRIVRLPRILWKERRSLVHVDVGLNRHNCRRAWMMTDPVEFNRAIEDLAAWSLDPNNGIGGPDCATADCDGIADFESDVYDGVSAVPIVAPYCASCADTLRNGGETVRRLSEEARRSW